MLRNAYAQRLVISGRSIVLQYSTSWTCHPDSSVGHLRDKRLEDFLSGCWMSVQTAFCPLANGLPLSKPTWQRDARCGSSSKLLWKARALSHRGLESKQACVPFAVPPVQQCSSMLFRPYRRTHNSTSNRMCLATIQAMVEADPVFANRDNMFMSRPERYRHGLSKARRFTALKDELKLRCQPLSFYIVHMADNCVQHSVDAVVDLVPSRGRAH